MMERVLLIYKWTSQSSHKPQSDNQGLYISDPYKGGSENPWPRPITRSIYSKSQVWNSALSKPTIGKRVAPGQAE